MPPTILLENQTACDKVVQHIHNKERIAPGMPMDPERQSPQIVCLT